MSSCIFVRFILLFSQFNIMIIFDYLFTFVLILYILFRLLLLFWLHLLFVVFLKRFAHHLYCYKHFLTIVIVTTYVLQFALSNKYLFNKSKTKYADEYSNSIVEDISGKVPKTLIRSAILIG